MGIFPNWWKEFSFKDLWGGVKADIIKIPTIAGNTLKDIVSPVLAGARSALTPTILWAVVIIIIGLILFKNYKKVVG